jgi:PAS domain S-box-containing protein
VVGCGLGTDTRLGGDAVAEGEHPTYRKQAREIYEQRLSHRQTEVSEDREALIEELRIHQIELELQNEDLRKARDDAELARDHYTTLFNAAPAALFVLDPDGVIEQANSRAGHLFDRSPSRLSGSSLYDFVATADRWAVEEALSHTRKDEPHRPPTVGLDAPGCDGLYVELTAARWRRSGAAGDSGFLVALSDVTASRRLEEEQQGAVVYYRRLLREMNHRVKNNLMVLSSIIDLERTRPGNGDALARVSERVRNVSRVHTALYHGSSDVDIVDVSASMKHFVEEFTRSLAAQVHLAFTPPGHDVFMDSRRALALSLIANELLTNAMQHAFPGGRSGKIHLSMSTQRGQLRLDISDNGVGMEQPTPGPESDGVGTQLVMQLVDELGGSWNLTSGNGTHHTIRVPVRSPDARPEAEHV